MISLAIVGIVVNDLGMRSFKQGQNQNEKILSWHLLEDILGWLTILIGGIIIYFWDNHIINPIMTIGFTMFVLWGIFRNLKSTLNIFMQRIPKNIDINKIKQSLSKIKGIKRIHDIHIWSLDGEINIFSGHIMVNKDILQNPDKTKK